MRCLMCGDTDVVEFDGVEDVGAALCVVCYESIAAYPNADRAAVIAVLRGTLPGVQARMMEGV